MRRTRSSASALAGRQGGRNSPVAYNRILSSCAVLGRPGRDARGAGQRTDRQPDRDVEHARSLRGEPRRNIPGYALQFEQIFPDGVTIDNAAKAIASFERALVTGPSPWDYYESFERFRGRVQGRPRRSRGR